MLNYILRNGRIYDEHDLHQAYEIVTGKKYCEDDMKYSIWLNSLFGERIVSVKKDDELTVGDILSGGSDKCLKIKGALRMKFYELFPDFVPQVTRLCDVEKTETKIADKWIQKNINKRVCEIFE